MEDKENASLSHAVYSSRLHIVFVTRYRRKTLTPELLDTLRESFTEILADWRCILLEFAGEADHVHLLMAIHPALSVSTRINNLKTASARRARNRFAEHLQSFYWKPYFWHRAYYVGSVGGATRETVRRYVESQGTKEKPRNGNQPA